MDDKPKKKIYKRWWFWIVVVVLTPVVILVVIAVAISAVKYFRYKATHQYNTATIYNFSWDGSVIKQMGKFSSLIDLKLNGDNKPLKIKVGDSFVFSWKIDSSLPLKGCDIAIWPMSGLIQELGDTEAVLGSSEGSWEFKNVVPEVATEQGLTFYLGENDIEVFCFGQDIPKERKGLYSVSIWLEK